MVNGSIASLVTPFRSDGTLELDALASFSNRVAVAGFDVVCFAGGTGEFLSMSARERESGLSAVVDGANGKPVLAGALFTCPKLILDASEKFARAGASAIMVMPPYFYAMDQDSMYEHLFEVARASSLPVLLFNSSARGGKVMSGSTVLRLAQSCANIVGVKETSESMDYMSSLVAGAPETFSVIQSHEPLILPSYAVGASGSFGSLCNLLPKTVVELHKAIHTNDMPEARRLTRILSNVAEVAYSVTIPVGIKYLMGKIGLHQGDVRSPLSMSSLDNATKARLDTLAVQISRLEAVV